MQKNFSRGCRSALALLLACSLLLVGPAVADAEVDEFDDGIVEDVQVSPYPILKINMQQSCPHVYTYIHVCVCVCMCHIHAYLGMYVDWGPVVTGAQKSTRHWKQMF